MVANGQVRWLAVRYGLRKLSHMLILPLRVNINSLDDYGSCTVIVETTKGHLIRAQAPRVALCRLAVSSG